jgi:hypothetical protein
MISIPIALALMFFIINASRREKNKHEISEKEFEQLALKNLVAQKEKTSASKKAETVPAEKREQELYVAPWNKIFGKPVLDTASKQVIKIENNSGADLVACLVDLQSRKVVRNHFVRENHYFFMENIPAGKFYLKVVYGKVWVANVLTTEFTYEGNFDSVALYAKFRDKNEIIHITKDQSSIADTITKVMYPYRQIPARERVENYEFFWKP